MSGRNRRAWRRPLALLAAVCAVVATFWMVVAAAVPAAAGASSAPRGHHQAKKHPVKRHAKKKHPVNRHAKKKHPAKRHAKKKHPAKRHAKPKPAAKPSKTPAPQPNNDGKLVTSNNVSTTLAGQLTSGSFTNGGGTLDYELYVPSSYKPGTAMPLVVALHGCTQTADSYRQLSGWDAEGESKGFIVLFPQQSSSRNSEECWNWFEQADMERGSGEPLIITGMVTAAEKKYSVDSQRVYVAGFSAGAAMANVMGATYPDMFAAVGSGSGCEYNGLPCLGNGGPDPSQTGQQAYQAMGSYARVMPAIIFQGSSDDIVAPQNGQQIAQEWQTTDNYVLSGSANGPVSTSTGPTDPNNPFGFGGSNSGYTKSYWGDSKSSDPSQADDLIEYWEIQGMNHAWSGGNASQQYSYPSGPNETDAMWSFFSSHPL
jgi:poly(hydroxyalkanoate) depolymerase family esterase